MGWVKRLRFAAGVLALALTASACSITSDEPRPTPGAIASRPTASSPGPTGTKQVPPGGASPGGPGQTNPGGVPPPLAYRDDGSVGSMTKVYLRSSLATSLLVEFDRVNGRDPSRTALDHLTSILRRDLDKPGGISAQLGNRVVGGRSKWSLDDLKALERANRANHSRGKRATIWIGYVDGEFAENASALAVTFSASASVIFRDRIDDAATALVMESDIERSVVLHEVGHMLALVNIGYRSRFDHEDRQHPYHSNNPESVMYWAVEDVSVRNILRGGPPDDFDDADRADLAQLRG